MGANSRCPVARARLRACGIPGRAGPRPRRRPASCRRPSGGWRGRRRSPSPAGRGLPTPRPCWSARTTANSGWSSKSAMRGRGPSAVSRAAPWQLRALAVAHHGERRAAPAVLHVAGDARRVLWRPLRRRAASPPGGTWRPACATCVMRPGPDSSWQRWQRKSGTPAAGGVAGLAARDRGVRARQRPRHQRLAQRAQQAAAELQQPTARPPPPTVRARPRRRRGNHGAREHVVPQPAAGRAPRLLARHQ